MVSQLTLAEQLVESGRKNVMNQKMSAVATAIEEVIINTFPVGYQMFVFEGKLTLEDIVSQVMVECCKYAYDNTTEKHSLKHYLDQENSDVNTEDSERMTKKRSLDYIQERRTIEFDYLASNGIVLDGLKAPNMKAIENRLEGYRLNALQFWEIKNVHDMRLVKGIVERRILAKNFTKSDFIEYSKQYDSVCNQFRNEYCDISEDMVFSFLVLFTLAWKYSFDFLYEIAEEMENSKVSEIPDMKRRLVAFCGTPQIDSLLVQISPNLVNERISIDSRMLIQRRKYINDIVTEPKGDIFEAEMRRFAEGLVIVDKMLTNMTYRKMPIREWFIQNTIMEDWATVFLGYNVFQVFISEKKWTNKKIRFVRNMYEKISFDYKNPDFRS